LYASLIGFNPRRLKVPQRGWTPTQKDLGSMQNLLLIIRCLIYMQIRQLYLPHYGADERIGSLT